MLHGVIVPRISDWRADIEERLGRELGIGVRIGAIEAQSRGFVPSFELRDVRFVDAQGRDTLLLRQVVATLSLRSLMQRGFEQLVIEQPTLDVRRDAQGVIHVAGLRIDPAAAAGDAALSNWLFSQRELAIRGGTLRWTDERRGAPALELKQVDVLLRNPGRQHLFRVQAVPPAAMGTRLEVVAQLRSPLFARHRGHWQEWGGQVYAHAAHVDVRQWRPYVDLGVAISSGAGSGRLWVDMERGVPVATVADLALANVDMRLASNLQPLAISNLSGRLSVQHDEMRLAFATQGLQFTTQEGMVWSGGNIRFAQTGDRDAQAARQQGRGQLSADGLDLGALYQIADRLPLGTATHSLLASFKPQGYIDSLALDWTGPYSAPITYNATGQATGLALAAQAATPVASPPLLPATTTMPAATSTGMPGVGRPGFAGLGVNFSLNERGGKARLEISKGWLDLPGVFEDPVIRLDRLQADASWSVQGERIELKMSDMRFANPDVEGQAQAVWRTADAAHGLARSRFPGVLDLQGKFSRAEGAQVHRYLPVSIQQNARHYVRDAVQAGQISQGTFRVKGHLHDMPFSNPALGEFRITGQISDAQWAYVPRRLQPEGSRPWPALTQLSGQLVLDRASMAVNRASARIGNAGVQLRRADARIDDLTHTPTVTVTAETQGSLAEMLAVVKDSPLGALTQQALSEATGTGSADVRLQLQLPLGSLDKTKVQGSLTLAGNDLQITPDSPRLQRARGVVQFSHSGFALHNASARMLGGDMRLEGGTRTGAGPDEASPVLHAQGVVTADGLRQARELGMLARASQTLTGSTAYGAVLGFRRGVPELSISSNLQGLGIGLPAPLNKAPEQVLPLRFSTSLFRDAAAGSAGRLQDHWSLDIGSLASVQFVRDLGSRELGAPLRKAPRVLRGGIAVGLAPGEPLVVGDSDVVANINFARIDVDAWERAIGQMTGSGADLPDTGDAPEQQLELGYLPTVMAIRAQELIIGGRALQQVVLGGSRDGLTWRANLDARQLNGYLEWRQPSGSNPGRVYARLARLSLASTAAQDIERAFDQPPQAIPALDIVVEDFELRGKKMGRLEVEAVNRGLTSGREVVREWRLNKLNLSMPEANFTASGNWAAVGASTTHPPAGRSERRRTVLNFKLDIGNSGDLLNRFGFDKVLARGKGVMQGQLGWMGSPLALDYPSLSGGFNVNIETGQFLKAEPGVAKLLGVLSLQSLPRRLVLDFRDVFTEGFSFDFVRGDIKIDQGIAFTNNLQMKGVNAAVLMEGKADIAKETQNVRVVVVPEINAGTASLVAAAINPAIGLGTFLAQLILRRPVIKATTQEFQIDGTWAEPRIVKVEREVTGTHPRTDSAPSTP